MADLSSIFVVSALLHCGAYSLCGPFLNSISRSQHQHSKAKHQPNHSIERNGQSTNGNRSKAPVNWSVRYQTLSGELKAEWDSRVISSVHAIIASIGAAVCLLNDWEVISSDLDFGLNFYYYFFLNFIFFFFFKLIGINHC